MNKNTTFKEQVRRNMVALISLAVAVTGLGYNTWRNEASEHNRNQRLVSIELLLMLAEVHQLTQDAHWGDSEYRATILREGWSKVLTIRDLAQIAEGSVPTSAMNLHETWGADYKTLGTDIEAQKRIATAVEAVRSDAHEVLRSLD